jgi:hypothetical protein
MWEDFMRGNWPVAAPPAPPRSHEPAADAAAPLERHRAAETRPAETHLVEAHFAETRGTETRAAAAARTDAVPGDGVVRGRRRIAARVSLAAGAALVLASLLPAVALAGGTGTPRSAAHSASVLAGPFVALGDSYASGNLIPDSPVGSPGGCLRSNHNYSADAVAALHVSHYIDATCTGAKLVNMTAPESVPLGTDPPQLNALAANDSVVTITMGGNDIGFASILVTCGLLSVTNPWGSPCKRHYTSGGTDRIAAAIKAEAPKIGALLQDIRARAPHARVLLVGYPDVLPNTGHGCFPVVPFAHGDVPYLRGVEVGLNRMLANEAAANSVIFVDTYTATIGHDACSPEDVRDVEGLIPTSLAYPFHPNRRGQLVMAGQVLAALRVS